MVKALRAGKVALDPDLSGMPRLDRSGFVHSV